MEHANENVESLSFPASSFDIVVTQDVFEHVADPRKGFAEICRVLANGGSHVFTVPWFPHAATRSRAIIDSGRVEHLLPAQYHGDPVNSAEALVFTDFARDLPELIENTTGMYTQIHAIEDERFGIKGDVKIFHSTKR